MKIKKSTLILIGVLVALIGILLLGAA